MDRDFRVTTENVDRRMTIQVNVARNMLGRAQKYVQIICASEGFESDSVLIPLTLVKELTVALELKHKEALEVLAQQMAQAATEADNEEE